MKTILLITGAMMSILVFGQKKTTLEIEKINSSTLKKGQHIEVKLYMNPVHVSYSSFQIYLHFNHDVLDYVSTQNIDPEFKEGWRDNITENFYAAVFVDFKQNGFTMNEKTLICEIEFVYKGGETVIKWGKESEKKDGALIKGETKFTDLKNNSLALELVDGCVCKTAK